MRKLREAEIKILLSDLTVIIDNREKTYAHITKYLDSKNIKYVFGTLKSGDYSVIINSNENLGIEEINLSDYVAVERKKNLDELANNLCRHRDRFFREFERFSGSMVILVEENKYLDLLTHNYRSEFGEQAFNNSLMKIKAEYDIDTFFLHDKRCSPIYIYTYLQAFTKKYLRELELEEVKEVV